MYKIVEKYEGVIIDKPINVKWGNYSRKLPKLAY